MSATALQAQNTAPRDSRSTDRRQVRLAPDATRRPTPPRPQIPRRRGDGDLLKDLREANPEQFRELMELREKDPEQFRQQVRSLLRRRMENKHHQRFEEEEKRIDDLAEAYHDAASDQKKDDIRAELRAELEKVFAERLAERRERLEDMKARIKEIETALDRRENSKKEIIDSHLEDLLKTPELRWRMHMPPTE
jgi:exonuclease VII large subunit